MSDFEFTRSTTMNRRCLLARAAEAVFGVTASAAAPGLVFGGARGGPGTGKAEHIIYIAAKGGMSQLDSFDPKPGRDEQGPVEVIMTATPGVRFGGAFPLLASRSEELVVIRSMATETGDHTQGQYLMRTGYVPTNIIRHPSLGAWVVGELASDEMALPPYVGVGIDAEHAGCGFLETRWAPTPIGDPTQGIVNMSRRRQDSVDDFNVRLQMAHRFDQRFKRRYHDDQVAAFDVMYREAVRLMGSEDIEAFDLAKEPDAVREKYGRGADGKLTFGGQGCLLARRLVEAGVPFIEVVLDGWDGHVEWFRRLPRIGGELDLALSALLEDLSSRGLLEKTLVVLTTEFGRSPKISANGGREHHPAAYCSMLAGAGVKAGVVHGATDDIGFAPETDAVSVADFNATIAAAAGLPYDKEFFAPNGRPFKIGGGGTPIREVLA